MGRAKRDGMADRLARSASALPAVVDRRRRHRARRAATPRALRSRFHEGAGEWRTVGARRTARPFRPLGALSAWRGAPRARDEGSSGILPLHDAVVATHSAR